MAQIVLIGEKSARKDISQVSDVISVHDDDVYLNPHSYADSIIIKVEATAKQVREELAKKEPEIWQDTDTKKYYYKDEANKDVEFAMPKYRFNIDLTTSEKQTLSSVMSSTESNIYGSR